MTVMETEDVSDLIRLVPSEEEEETRRSLYHMRAQRAGSHLQVRRELSRESDLTGTLVSDLQPPEMSV